MNATLRLFLKMVFIIGLAGPTGAQAELLRLRFFCGETTDNNNTEISRYIVWLNNEPVDYDSQGSVFDVVGYPIKLGRNQITLQGVTDSKEFLKGIKVAVFSGGKFAFLDLVDGSFFIPARSEVANDWKGREASEVDVDVAKMNAFHLLQAIAGADHNRLAAQFKYAPEAFLKTLPSRIFTKGEKTVDLVKADSMTVSKGVRLILVHRDLKSKSEKGVLLSIKQPNFSYEVRSLRLFCNADGELALYVPDISCDIGIVLKQGEAQQMTSQAQQMTSRLDL